MTRRNMARLVLVLPWFVFACGGDEGAPRVVASTPSTSTQAPAQVSTPSQSAPATPMSSPPPAAAAGAVLASTDGETAGLAAHITQLKRDRGNTVTLRFQIANNSGDERSFIYWLGDKDTNTVGGVHLIDPVNNKKYFVVRDAENNCVCSSDMKPLPAGQSANLWAKFPAPPAEVDRVSVVIPHFIPVDDVPISR